MKKAVVILSLLVIGCSAEQTITDIEEETTTSISTTTTVKSLVVDNFEDLQKAVARIQVISTKAELNNDLEIVTYEYEGTGSGFFISNDGYLITNNHVISGAVSIDVYTQLRSQPYRAKIIGLSECDDLAILKIDIENVNYLELSTVRPKLGQEIIAVGFPNGDEEVTFLDGIVSKKETDGSTSWASIDYAFEHTAEILPGSSGGPIVNDNVQVIGIAYAGNELRQEFGIPIDAIKNKINQIIDNSFQSTFNANLEQFEGIGLYVYSVESTSPLKSLGLSGGEIITEIKGLNITDETTLKIYCDAIYSRNPDEGIRFKGIKLKDFSEFDIEASLDGSVLINNIYNNQNNYQENASESSSNDTTDSTSNTTTTT